MCYHIYSVNICRERMGKAFINIILLILYYSMLIHYYMEGAEHQLMIVIDKYLVGPFFYFI